MINVFGLLVLAAFLSCHARLVSAEQTVLSDDGREVRLFEDGSWEYASDDRFATTEDGQRVRLKADGTWSESADDRNWVAVPAQSIQQSRDLVTEGELKVELETVRVESVRTRQQKNSRLRSQIVATLSITSETENTLVIDTTLVTLTDSRGREYPIVALAPGELSLVPGSSTEVTLIGDGSPRWFGVKFFRLAFEPGVLGEAEVGLTKAMSEVTRLDLDALTVL